MTLRDAVLLLAVAALLANLGTLLLVLWRKR